MNHALNFENVVIPVKSNVCKLHGKISLFVCALVVFVAVAAMQTIQLGTLLSEAKSIGTDINDIRAEQKILHEQYSFYNNNISYFFEK